LPFQLITPGRTFLKRGLLLQLERSSAPKEREFLLFSDCLIWFASAEKGDGDLEDWDWNGGANKDRRKSLGVIGAGGRPPLERSQSKSEAEILSLLDKSRAKGSNADLRSAPTTPTKKRKVRQASNGTEEKWVYKGKADLVDLEVVISRPMEDGEERRFEVLSPEISFALYACERIYQRSSFGDLTTVCDQLANEQERDEWSTAIRQAKASLLVSLNAIHPNSTLTSSSSTNHLRRSLQALPHAPEEEHQKPKRGKVEHFLPAIWIPDAKTESCMRCGRSFGWRRRRHHCRLCGRCVCASCSGKVGNYSSSLRMIHMTK
jgi:FYVE, RhoGEF and PH domain containing 5/6